MPKEDLAKLIEEMLKEKLEALEKNAGEEDKDITAMHTTVEGIESK